MNFVISKKTMLLLAFVLILGAVAVLGLIFYTPYPLKYKAEIMEASQKFDVAPEVVASMINAESGFNENAHSSKGALGLMQIMPSTAKWLCELQGLSFQEKDLLNPQTNIFLGTYYMQYLLKKFESLESAICAYNAGEGNVMLWLLNDEYALNNKIISTPFPETNAYLEKVMAGIKVYQKKFNAD